EARRPPCRTAHQVRAGHQSQDREGAWLDHPPIATPASRSSYSVSRYMGGMDRRTFLSTLGVGVLAAPLAAEAQPTSKTFKVGLLATLRPSGNPPAGPASGESLVVALKELGYIEGRTIVIERRYSEGFRERLPDLAAELAALKPDAIFAYGALASAAVHRATGSIPIVAVSSDLVSEGLVGSLARPGGNITGLQTLWADTAGKRLALLKEAIPSLSRAGLLFAGPPGSQ